MTEAKAGQPRSPLGEPITGVIQSPENQRTINFREVAGMALRPGDQIVGMNTLEELDTFADTVAVNLTGRSFRLRKPGQRVTSSEVTRLSDSLKHDGERSGCVGAIRNFRVVVCSSDPDKTLVIEVSGSLSSTGRGEIATIFREATFSVKVNGDPELKSRVSKEKETRRDLRRVLGSTILAACDPGYNVRAGAKRIR